VGASISAIAALLFEVGCERRVVPLMRCNPRLPAKSSCRLRNYDDCRVHPSSGPFKHRRLTCCPRDGRQKWSIPRHH
jgi:hypothetical protein